MKILLVGPLSPPVHGQSVAFTRFVQSVHGVTKTVVNTNLESNSPSVKVIKTAAFVFLIGTQLIFRKYDVVYFTCARSVLGSFKDIVLITLASFRSSMIVNHLHGSDFYEFLHGCSWWYRKVLLSSYKKVNTSIVLTEGMKLQFRDFDHMTVSVVRNFYEDELDREFASKHHHEVRLVYLSNVMYSKGIFELIHAFDVLSQQHDFVRLSIAGDFMGDSHMSRRDVEARFCSEIHGKSNISYLGLVKGEDKAELLQGSDIFVLPTYYRSEAIPLSIIEAMACGNAIVSTSFKYIPELVTEKNGILVAPGSSDALIDAISLLIRDRQKMRDLQEHNRKEAQEKYKCEKYLRELNKIILSLKYSL